jgi:hypothetical protein
MSIALTDIADAVTDYLETQVITTVSAVTPDDTDQDVLTPGQTGTFTVSATNGDAAKGVRLVNTRYHVASTHGAVLKLIPPAANSLTLQAYEDEDLNTAINDDTPRRELYIVTFINTALDAGETGSFHLGVTCLDQGQTTINARLVADVDQAQLFANGESQNGKQVVEVA